MQGIKFLIKWIGYSVVTFLSIVLLGTVISIGGLYYFGSGLPDHRTLSEYDPDVSSNVFLEDGTVLKEFAAEKRTFIPIENIPENLKHAFLSAEDKNFYTHYGIDLVGIFRSLINNILSVGQHKRPQGASTITQQVARIFLVGSNELSYTRKIREALLAFRIENTMSKDKILELYLNQIYLGNGTYGVSAASKYYFSKSLSDLDIAECCLLAALAKGASYYDPVKHKERAIARRNWVIRRMLESGYINKDEFENACNQEFSVAIDCDSKHSGFEYYAEEVRKEIYEKADVDSINKNGFTVFVPMKKEYQIAAEIALKNGLEKLDRQYGWRGAIGKIDYKIDTVENDLKNVSSDTFNPLWKKGVISRIHNKDVFIRDISKNEYQIVASDVTWANSSKNRLKIGDVVFFILKDKKAYLKQVPIVQGAIVVIDSNSGKVLAIQGGYDFYKSKFNRATQAMRQVGSCFKPIVYLTALEYGCAPNMLISGAPVSIDLGGNLGVWTPKNFMDESVGLVTLRAGLERSLNTVTVRVAQLAGLQNIGLISEKLGVFKKSPKVWSMVLGACESTLLKLTAAYCTMSNGGYAVVPRFIEHIQDKDGKNIYQADNDEFIKTVGADVEYPPLLNKEKTRVISAESAYQITSLMCGSVLRGTSRGALQLNIPLAGKTGTSNDSKDNWFIACTPDIAVGVLVCFDDASISLGKNAVGATTALPIFVEFMKLAKLDKNKIPFRVPNGITFKSVDKYTGKQCSYDSKSAILEAFKKNDKIDVAHINNEQTLSDVSGEKKTQDEIDLIY